jgi:four helix bundle protein
MRHLRHHNLAAWKHADELFFAVHRVIAERFPWSERYELSSQLRRAALSVPANIAEGFAYSTPGERRQFLRTAWASLVEADYYVSVADRLNYLDDPARKALDRLTRLTTSALSGLIATLLPKRGTRGCDHPAAR